MTSYQENPILLVNTFVFDILSLLSYDRMILLYDIDIRYSNKNLSLLLFLSTNVHFSIRNCLTFEFYIYSYE